MKHLGDITKIRGCAAPITDVVIGGSPCQDLSIAGKREGLAGERSGLFMEQIRIVKEMRYADRCNGRTGQFVRPRFMVWENVPGAFSSNKGEDFRAVLEEICRIADETTDVPRPKTGKWNTSGVILGAGWSVAWRVLDAQFWGVPQRRRRIALVADFGGCTAPEILFERNGLCWDSAQSGEAGQGTARDSEGCIDKTVAWYQNGNGECFLDSCKTKTVQTNSNASGRGMQMVCQPVTYPGVGITSKQNASNPVPGDPCHTLNQDSRNYVCYGVQQNASGINAPLVAEPTFCIQGNCIDRADTAGCNGKGWKADQSYTLNTVDRPAVCYGFKLGNSEQARSIGLQEERSPTLNAECGGNKPSVCYDMTHATDVIRECGETAPTLQRRMGTGGNQVPLTLAASVCDDVAHSVKQNVGRSFREDADSFVCEPVFCSEDIPHMSPQQELSPCLSARGYKSQNFVNVAAVDVRNNRETGETFRTLQAKENGGQSLNYSGAVRTGHAVRRLTPLECERLQGYPDGWTDIGTWTDSKGKLHKESSDSARYKALGNSIALPPWKWVLKRLCAFYERDATMASLFDGIGGFPLIWEQLNGKGSCLWASEIEDFPMAVTKARVET